MRKSPKDKDKNAKKTPAAAVHPQADDPAKQIPSTNPVSSSTSTAPASHVKPYEYTDEAGSPTKRNYRTPGGFRYDEDPAQLRQHDTSGSADDSAQLSPNSQARRATGLAFNYAPGADADKLKQKAGQLSPKSQRDSDVAQLAYGSKNSEQSSPPSRSYSPNKAAASAAGSASSEPEQYRVIGDPNASSSDPSTALLSGERDAAAAAAAISAAAPQQRYKRIKVLIIVSRFDPKTRRIDAQNGHVRVADAVLDKQTGTIDTPYGVVDPKTGTVVRPVDPQTGRSETVRGTVDPKTGHVHVTQGGVRDPETLQLNETLGQIICVGGGRAAATGTDSIPVAITAITGRINQTTGRIDTVNGDVEHSTGQLHADSGLIDTKYGQIDPVTGRTRSLDPKTGKPTSVNRASTVDAQTGHIQIVGAADPRTGKQDNQLGHLIAIGQPLQDAAVVEVITITGKPDAKRGGAIQPATLSVARSRGLASTTVAPGGQQQRIVDTKYGQINLVKHTIAAQDPKTGKTEARDFKVDPATGQLIIRGGVVNPDTGKVDKDFVQLMSVRTARSGVAGNDADPKVEDVRVDPKTNQIWVPSGTTDPATGKPIYTTAVCDPKTGQITIVYGYVSPQSGDIERQLKLDANVTRIDPVTGQVFTATGERDAADDQPLYAVSAPDAEQGGRICTKLAKVDPKTGKLTIIRITPVFDKAPVVAPSSTASSPTHTPSKSNSAASSAPSSASKTTTPADAAVSATEPTSATKAPKTVTAKGKSVQPPKAPTPNASSSAATKGVAGAGDAFIPVAASSLASAAGIGSSTTESRPIEAAVLDVITLIGTLDSKTGRIDPRHANIERTTGLLNTRTGFISTKYGQLHPVSGECRIIDPRTGAVQSVKKAHVDPFTGQITIKGVTDPRTGRLDQQLTQQVTFGAAVVAPLVEVTSLAGRYDAKRSIIEPKNANLERTLGQLDPETGTIATQYGRFDLRNAQLHGQNPRTGAAETRPITVDPSTGQAVLRNEVNPKTGKSDKDWARIVTMRIVSRQPVAGADGAVDDGAAADVHTDRAVVIVEPKTNRIWTPIVGRQDPSTGAQLYAASQIDPHTGYIITVYGVLNAKSNEIEPQSGSIGENSSTAAAAGSVRIDPISGQVFQATGECDEITGEPLFAVSQVDPDSNEVYTKVGRIDPKTGKLVLIKILLVTRHDAAGRPQVVDPATCDVDQVTGRIRNVFNKTVYVYNMVDPVTGEIVQVDPNDPRMAGARTTVTQTMTLSGEIDEQTGRIKTEYGHIDPETGDIDPATAVRDPVTGVLILNYAQIDPSHFGKAVTVTKETVPISRDQFYDGIKHLGGKAALRRDSEASSDEDVQAFGGAGGDESGAGGRAGAATAVTTTSRYATAPTVVKTTTKQVLTKNEDGVTHNVEEEIRNLGTGEVVFSTQEHKVGFSACDGELLVSNSSNWA